MTQPEMDAIIRHNGGKESAILAILQDIQAKEKYLPKETLEQVSQKMHIPIIRTAAEIVLPDKAVRFRCKDVR